jgi:NAD(P) transhydrogenase
MTNESHYDVVVIGSGPGGEGAAMNVTKQGKSVAVIERSSNVGGNCTHFGTIPSKALRYAIFRLAEARKNPIFRQARVMLDLSFPQLREASLNVVRKQVDMRSTFYERNHVPVVRGNARFLDDHTVEAEDENGVRQRLTANGFVIATGARPYHPPDVDFTHPRIFDSDSILNLPFTPQSVTIYGAGIIGCEYASMLRNLELKVNLVNTRDKLLEFLDDEIIDALAYHMRDLGILIRHREEYERVEGCDDGVILYLKSGKQIKTDILLWANGRTGNTDGLGLEQLGILPDKRGQIPVDENYRTDVHHIYAVGDVIGFPALASAAYVQGRHAAARLVGGEDVRGRHEIPTGIYTSPEISSIGKNERELTEQNVPYEVGHAFFRSLARAQITGQTVGMLKLLFHRETLAILGVHCFGANAAEIVHIGQAIMAQPAPHNSLEYFLNTTFNYPTMAEAYRVAALNGYNRLF